MMHNTGIKSGSAEIAPGALSVTGPQPVWMTLDEARERAFTGEIVFEVDPEVLAYLDHGVVYYAERASDASLGRRLLESGVLDTGQLERGTVRVGDIEHLGRLFDRDASVDRDAVLVVTETSTEELIADLANQAVATVRVTAYRHHPSGIHRWFVAQLDPQLSALPTVTLEHPVVEGLGGLSLVPDVTDDELTIEWDEFTDPMPTEGSNRFDLFMFDPFREVEQDDVVEELVAVVDADDSFDVDVIELSLDMAAFVDADVVSLESLVDDEPLVEVVAVDDDLSAFDFQVMWPNGAEESVFVDAIDAVVPEPVDDPVFTQTDDGELRFEMPELALGADDEATEEVPDDVADAVRRAIAAIESASVEAPTIAPIEFPSDDAEPAVVEGVEMQVAEPVVAASDSVEVTSQMTVVQSTPPAFAGFAPPTMAMSAEVMYAEFAEQPAEAIDTTAVSPSLPAHGVASVVFVDDEPIAEPSGGSGNERSSALRRLIGGLRRKEH